MIRENMHVSIYGQVKKYEWLPNFKIMHPVCLTLWYIDHYERVVFIK